jgi:hypothetical protein
MRKGTELVKNLLTCRLKSFGPPPPDWSSGNFRRMFAPDIAESNYSIEFDDIQIVGRESLDRSSRIAILSHYGVNLLLQRWIFHNSRVLIPTSTISEQTVGPMEEADLIWEVLTARDPSTEEIDVERTFDEWLGFRSNSGGQSRREMLSDSQQRSSVRAAARREFQM